MGRLIPGLCQEGVEVLWRWPGARQRGWYSSLHFLMGLGANNCSVEGRRWKVTTLGEREL